MKQFFVYLTIPCQQIELLTYLRSIFYKERESAGDSSGAKRGGAFYWNLQNTPSHKRTKNVSIRLHKDLIAELRREIEQNKINFNTLTSYCSSQSLVEAYLWRTKLGWNI